MRWAALCAAAVILWGCGMPIVGGGSHVQAHGKTYMHITELSVSEQGWLRFSEGGVPVLCFSGGCVIGEHLYE